MSVRVDLVADVVLAAAAYQFGPQFLHRHFCGLSHIGDITTAVAVQRSSPTAARDSLTESTRDDRVTNNVKNSAISPGNLLTCTRRLATRD